MIYTYVVAHFWPWFFIGGCIFLAAVIGFTVWYVLTEPVHDTDDGPGDTVEREDYTPYANDVFDDDWQHEPAEEDTWNAQTAVGQYEDAVAVALPARDGITYQSAEYGLATGAIRTPASNTTVAAALSHDQWEALDPDQAAAQLIAEWHSPDLSDPLTSYPGRWDGGDWRDDPDLVVWDAKQQAARCWEIVHVEFPRLRAELCAA